jgi:hypothetical protein
MLLPNQLKIFIVMRSLVFSLILGGLFQQSAFSQSCLPEGIRFYAQSQIDNFQFNYPGCTEIEGDVLIDSNLITNLNGLSVLISVGRINTLVTVLV